MQQIIETEIVAASIKPKNTTIWYSKIWNAPFEVSKGDRRIVYFTITTLLAFLATSGRFGFSLGLSWGLDLRRFNPRIIRLFFLLTGFCSSLLLGFQDGPVPMGMIWYRAHLHYMNEYWDTTSFTNLRGKLLEFVLFHDCFGTPQPGKTWRKTIYKKARSVWDVFGGSERLTPLQPFWSCPAGSWFVPAWSNLGKRVISYAHLTVQSWKQTTMESSSFKVLLAS